jgi:hypothetical protein
VYVTPGADSVADGSYNPLARRLYMNVLNEPDVLSNVAPFLYYAYSADGSSVVSTTGYVPIPNPSEMLARLPTQAGANGGSTTGGSTTKATSGAATAMGSMVAAVLLLGTAVAMI